MLAMYSYLILGDLPVPTFREHGPLSQSRKYGEWDRTSDKSLKGI